MEVGGGKVDSGWGEGLHYFAVDLLDTILLWQVCWKWEVESVICDCKVVLGNTCFRHSRVAKAFIDIILNKNNQQNHIGTFLYLKSRQFFSQLFLAYSYYQFFSQLFIAYSYVLSVPWIQPY